MKRKIEIEPYQPFFLSGLLISLLGLAVWIFSQQGWLSYYPQETHASLMILGFLTAYITGFLMTAVPKMSQSQAAQPFEIGFGLVLLFAQVGISFAGLSHWSYGVGIFQILFLFYFVLIRFFRRKANPPKAFAFLPFGLGAALCGCASGFLGAESLSPAFLLLGKNLLHQAFVLNLILGLGSRLVPALTRVKGALDVRAAGAESVGKFVFLALVLNCSFVLEVFVPSFWGQLLKFSVIAWMAVFHFKILEKRQVPGFLSTGIRASVVCLGLGFLFSAIRPDFQLHFLHLSYIGGFALLTFLISTRVVLAHGGYDLSLELKSRELGVFFALAILLGLGRVSLGFEPGLRSFLLWILFLGWALLCALWSRSFLKKLLKLPTGLKPS